MRIHLFLMVLLWTESAADGALPAEEKCTAGNSSCEASGGGAAAGGPQQLGILMPVYTEVAAGTKTAVCIVSREAELPGLRIALLTILLLQPQMKVQLFAFEWVEEALADAVSRMVSVLAADGRVQVIRLGTDTGGNHHGYGMLLKDENFWLACDGELVLVFQADTMLCRGADTALQAFEDFDYVGAPFRPGACPPGHDKDRSMCQDDFDKMAIHANLSIPVGVGGNGGLSFRRRSKMLEVVAACKDHPFRTWNEDIFFSYPCDAVTLRLPPEELARRFSVETGVLHASPVGVHKPWAYRTDAELAVLAVACPELLLLMPS